MVREINHYRTLNIGKNTKVSLYSSVSGNKGGKRRHRLPQMQWLRLKVSQGGCQRIVLGNIQPIL